MNQLTIIGRMGKDPEISSTQSGKQLAKFSVAVTRQYEKEKSDWFNVTVWGKSAEYVSNYLGKGRLVAVTGRIESREYEGKTYWDVTAESVQGLDRPRDDDQSGYTSSSSGSAQTEEEPYDPFA